MGPDPTPEPDRDLVELEALERELAVLEHELEGVDGAPGDGPGATAGDA